MKYSFLECGGKWTKEISGDRGENHPGASRVEASAIREILVIFFCGIGDMVVFIPALEALSTFFSKSRISVMTSPPAHELLDHHPRIKTTFLLDAVHRRGFFRKFDLIINLSGHKDEINRILNAANVKHLISRDRLFTRRGPFHASEYHLELIKEITTSFQKPLVYLKDEERRAAREYLIKRRVHPGNDLLIAVHPGSSNPGKLWDWRRFRKVCNLLIRDDKAKILLLSGPAEQDVTRRITSKMSPGLTVVEEPLRLVAALLGECTLLITNDSGIMHLSAAVGTPIVSIFNTSLSKPEIWGPLSDDHVVIRKGTHEAIRVEDVMRGVRDLLNRVGKSPMRLRRFLHE